MMSCSQSLHSFIYLLFFCFHCLRTSVCSDNSSYDPIENIALSCGSSDSHILSYDGRNWTGDVGTQYVAFSSGRNSTISTVSSVDPSVPQVPYLTARLFHSKFTYRFNVTPGPKFVRLHFYPNSSYLGLDASKAFLSVTSGHHTLLRNFSPLLTASYLKAACFFKEFVIPVGNHTLDLIFSPSSNAPDAYAFVNGIEVISMPLNLYIDSKKPLPLVGYPGVVLTLDNKSALETAYRINVGGNNISPKQDTGMLRTWTNDADYIFGAASGEQPYDLDVSIMYSPAVPAYTAPEDVYRTARSMGRFSQINVNYNLSWFFPIDTGFLYLVRLHFCEVLRSITKVNQMVFDIFINNQTAESGVDIIAGSRGYGVPFYKDYVVLIPAMREGMQDLWLALHPNIKSKSEWDDALLNGVEIFKVSNNDGNLAGLNPPQHKSYPEPSSRLSRKSNTKILIIAGCLISGVILALLVLCFLAFWLKNVREGGKRKKISESQLCQHYSISDMKRATNNFDKVQVIGYGGFGVVYKGYLNYGATIVAIKRGNQASIGQGFYEFNAEIMSLSNLRHQNVVSLIGYCNDDHEMILVYEYMSNGTLYDHLHLVDQLKKPALSWNQRLEICIGAARGLHYLHTGTKAPIIHRDIKTTNILIDNNWEAKVSDFGLSKVCPTTISGIQVSTNIKGSIGYLDPEYYRHQVLTDKSDVYSFGVVLLEVLSARPVLNPIAEDNPCSDDRGGDNESLVEWALSCLHKGDMDQLIDTHLRGMIKPASLAKFLDVACKCLAEGWVDRPSMSEVLCSLELALQLQLPEQNESDISAADKKGDIDSVSNSDMTPGVEFSEIMLPMGR